MPTFKTITSDDIKTTTSVLNQLVDFVEEDIESINTRKKYQVFVTSSAGTTATNSVTSSLFQTVYDQNYTLQTANELFDMTMGLYFDSDTVNNSTNIAPDAAGKLLFPSQSLMMREKINIYRQHAQLLLGDADARFTAPFTSNDVAENNVDEALFINFKRLFVRDGIKRETFAIKMFQSSSYGDANWGDSGDILSADNGQNLTTTAVHPPSGSAIFTDVGSSTSIEKSPTGGDVGNIVNASNTSETVGLMFYQQGIAVFDMKKVFNPNQLISGSLSSVGEIGSTDMSGSFIPDLVVSASIDDVIDHVASTRFGSGSNTTITFQNNTRINSTLYFCRATADEFNYSTNPSYTDDEGRIRPIFQGQEGVDKSFSFVTTVGLYDAKEELLAVAKLSRPVEKNDEKDMTFRVRLDF
jgi:hypothetical protein